MPCIFAMIAKFRYHSELFSMIAKFTAKRNLSPCVLVPNDLVLYNSHFIPFVIICFRYFWYFTHFGWLYKPPYSFCNPNFNSFKLSARSFCFNSKFALFSLFFLSFSWLPNASLEDDNSRDAWLSLKALKRRVSSLVIGGLAVSSCFKQTGTAFMVPNFPN